MTTVTATRRPRNRESIDEKADRLLTAGRVWVETCAADLVRARVIGDSGTAWTVTHEVRWSCTCPYPRPSCGHVIAVQRVIDRENPMTLEKRNQ